MSSDPLHEIDDPIARITAAKQKQRRIILGFAGAVLAAMAVIPRYLGFGVFGISAAMAHNVNVWVYNTTGGDASLTMTRIARIATPEVTRLEAWATQTLYPKTGERTLTLDFDGQMRRFEYDLQRDTFISLGNTLCYAVFDVTELYNAEAATAPAFTVVDRIPAHQNIYEPTSRTFIPPRARMPQTASTPVHWMEDVDCGLLNPTMNEALEMRAQTILQEREMPDEEL